jgi:hypothetical protein
MIIRLGILRFKVNGARSCNHTFHKTIEASSTKIKIGRCGDREIGIKDAETWGHDVGGG